MMNKIDFGKLILNTWKTTNRTTIFLIENIPPDLWKMKVSGLSRTVGMISSHIHNIRCMWIKMSAQNRQSLKVPTRVDSRNANREDVIKGLNQSSNSMLKLLEACIDNGGKLPTKPAWLNFPNDVIHLLNYFVAHEAHHRGQIILIARYLNHRLALEVTDGVWQWTKRLKEVK